MKAAQILEALQELQEVLDVVRRRVEQFENLPDDASILNDIEEMTELLRDQLVILPPLRMAKRKPRPRKG
jgi:hypothetical protein